MQFVLVSFRLDLRHRKVDGVPEGAKRSPIHETFPIRLLDQPELLLKIDRLLRIEMDSADDQIVADTLARDIYSQRAKVEPVVTSLPVVVNSDAITIDAYSARLIQKVAEPLAVVDTQHEDPWFAVEDIEIDF